MSNIAVDQPPLIKTGQTDEWWRGAVLYQVYPRSFADSNDDGIGDLNGLYEKLDYIASLGVDGIWISPFFKSPMKDFGYDVSDYCMVDPIFGTNADFEHVIEKCHRLELKVLVDLVSNHTSDQHDWFKQSRSNKNNDKADWYVWADPDEYGRPPNNWLSVFGGEAWEFDPNRQQYYLHSFLKEQPDLNWRNPAVEQAMHKVMRFWLDRGVDGFRLDACHHMMKDPQMRDNPFFETPHNAQGMDGMGDREMPYDKMEHKYDMAHPDILHIFEKMRNVMNEYQNRMIVGEVSGRNQLQLTADFTKGGNRLQTAYNFSLLGVGRDPEHIKNTVKEMEKIIDDGWPSWSFSNHDVARTAKRWSDNKHRADIARLGIAVLCSLRGTVFIYQGEELGLTEADIAFEDLQDPYGINNWPKFKGRDGCRTPMPWIKDASNAGFSSAKPWLPVAEDHYALAVDIQDSDPNSVLNYTRRFLKWRRNHPSLIRGDIRFDDQSPDNILAFTRNDGDDHILCVFNFGDTPVRYQVPEGAKIVDAPCPSGIQGHAVQKEIPAISARFYILAEDSPTGTSP